MKLAARNDWMLTLRILSTFQSLITKTVKKIMKFQNIIEIIQKVLSLPEIKFNVLYI